MENLIKAQAIINQIEDATLSVLYHSEFEYPDADEMIIKTFCKEQTIKYMLLLSNMNNTCWYLESNTEIKVLDLNKI